MSLVTFSQFTSTAAPLTGDYLVGYRFSDPIAQTNPYEFKTTVGGLVRTVQASLTGNSLSLDGSNNLNIPSSIVYAAGVVATGDITSSANGSFANVQGRQIQLIHGNPNDGINPEFFIGETSGGSLSGFRSIYDEIRNRYVLRTQFGTTPPISAVVVDSLGNTTFANSISARNNLSAANVFATSISASRLTATNISASGLSATNISASGLSATNIYSLSNIGIGTTTPIKSLTVVGDISATGDIFSIKQPVYYISTLTSTVNIGTAYGNVFANTGVLPNGSITDILLPNSRYEIIYDIYISTSSTQTLQFAITAGNTGVAFASGAATGVYTSGLGTSNGIGGSGITSSPNNFGITPTTGLVLPVTLASVTGFNNMLIRAIVVTSSNATPATLVVKNTSGQSATMSHSNRKITKIL